MHVVDMELGEALRQISMLNEEATIVYVFIKRNLSLVSSSPPRVIVVPWAVVVISVPWVPYVIEFVLHVTSCVLKGIGS